MITTKTVHMVNDQDVTTLSDDQLLAHVKELETHIKELEAVESESKFVKKKVKEAKETLGVVLAHLDERA